MQIDSIGLNLKAELFVNISSSFFSKTLLFFSFFLPSFISYYVVLPLIESSVSHIMKLTENISTMKAKAKQITTQT